MPGYVAPHKSGAHRVTGIALFRALLNHCRLVPLDESTKTTALNVIRNSFKRNRHAASKVLLRKAFNAGYDALGLLVASARGHGASCTRITTLLASTSPHLSKSPPRVPPIKLKTKPKGRPVNPDSSAVLSRPRLSVPGRRHIPVLVSAVNYPMLRFKKPQPDNLGAYLNKKSMKRQRRHDHKDIMAEKEPMGVMEDRWDEIVAKIAQQEGKELEKQEGEDAEDWAWGFKYNVWYLNSKLEREHEKSLELVKKMEEVIRQERALAEKEESDKVGGYGMSER